MLPTMTQAKTIGFTLLALAAIYRAGFGSAITGDKKLFGIF